MRESTFLANDSRERTTSLLLLYTSTPAASAVFQRLSTCGHSVMLCPLATAIERWQEQFDPDVVIFVADGEDAGLVERCASIRERTDRPIVVLADRCEEQLIARALNAGIDEYVSTSVGDQELFARIDALLRRSHASVQNRWQVGGLVLCANELSAETAGRRVCLTPIEFRLLSCLASAPGKVFTHETLMSRVWGAEYVDARHYLYLYIRYLREKLEPDAKHPQLIVSEWGVGYRLQPPDVSASPNARRP